MHVSYLKFSEAMEFPRVDTVDFDVEFLLQ